jgi:hypothetical protein
MADVEKITDPAQLEKAAPQDMEFVHIEPAVQKRVVRKLDLNLMPLVVSLCM